MDGQRRDAWIAGQMDRCMGGGAGKGGGSKEREEGSKDYMNE